MVAKKKPTQRQQIEELRDEVQDLEAQLADAAMRQRLSEDRVEALQAENQIWRELLVEFREAVTPHLQYLGHSQKTDRMRKLMRDPAAMEEEIRKRLEDGG